MSGKMCATCAHDGQCDGLPYCGGKSWEACDEDCDEAGENEERDPWEDYDERDERDYRGESWRASYEP